MEIPVYLVNGFLESGKTTFIKNTLSDPDFTENKPSLVIACEEGEEEFTPEELSALKTTVVTVDSMDEITKELVDSAVKRSNAARIFVELNGMWKVNDFLHVDLPRKYPLVQIITLVDASTYTNYFNNMKAFMLDQVRDSDTIFFNRCDDSTDVTFIRRSIKPVNRKAQIIYERADGTEMNGGAEILPFDKNAPVIELNEEDYGLWYLDAMEHPDDYAGKKIHFLAQIYKSPKLPDHCIVPGRFAMTCCAADIQFVGFLCKVPKQTGPLKYEDLVLKQFAEITADIKVEYFKDYNGMGPVLYATEIKNAAAPADDLVYYT
jgi:uncharacterized membrane protein YcgQ (UPF0703/DUF1980 family)